MFIKLLDNLIIFYYLMNLTKRVILILSLLE